MPRDEEIWKLVTGYEGLYEVSSHGRVKSPGNNKERKEKILKFGLDRGGYQLVTLCKNGKQKTPKVHRLVAIHFINNPNNKPCVNHLDGDKTNNYYLNLEWCTYSENNKHAYEYGLKNSDHCTKKVYCFELNQEFESASEASRKLNINRGNISSCCRGDVLSAGKHTITNEPLTWKYV